MMRRCDWRVVIVLVVLLLVSCQREVPLPETLTAPTWTPTAVPDQILDPSPTPEPLEAAQTPAPELISPTIEVPSIAEGLQGLPIDAFFEESYKRLLLRSPQYVTELGMSDAFGSGDDLMDDLSDAYALETQELETAILTLLRTYDRASLSPEQQLSYDVYLWYLEDRVRGHEFFYDDYLVSPGVAGYQGGLEHFLTQIHPLNDQQNAEDYVTRLSHVGEQMDQVVEAVNIRADKGVLLPRFVGRWVASELRAVSRTSPTSTSFYTSFAEKLNALDEISEADKLDLLAAAKEAIRDSVLPSYAALADCLEAQQTMATDEIGASKFPNGREYYEYILQHFTTTDLTADEIHEIGLQEVERIKGDMYVLFESLGYDTHEDIPALYDRLIRDSGLLYDEDIQAGYEAIIEEAKQGSEVAFDLRPKADVIVVGGQSGGYYTSPALDGSRPGMFFAATVGVEPIYKMPSLAYHESVPGHHYQLAIAQELDLPLFRNDIGFIGHIEGWALYAEWLASDLGWYDDDVYGDLGRLQYEMFRAVRLVVDTGIHAKGWTYDQTLDYMVDNIGFSRGALEGELWRYITWPGQATAYKIGMLKIMELRQRTEDALGDAFDLKTFHNVILGSGSVPLDVLEQLVDDYIASATE